MAKDDYHVIVCKILLYLYNCLKGRIAFDTKELNAIVDKSGINENYWNYILYHIASEGLIEGLCYTKTMSQKVIITNDLSCCQISPKGIEYLQENSSMGRAKEFIKEAGGLAATLLSAII